MSESAEWEEIVEGFSESLGREKSEELVTKAARKSGVNKKSSYDEEEAMELLNEISSLDDSTTYLKIAANSMKTNLRTKGTI